MLSWEGMHRRKGSAHIQYGCNIVLDVSHPQLIECTDLEPKDTDSHFICPLDTLMDCCRGCWVREMASMEGQAGTLGNTQALRGDVGPALQPPLGLESACVSLPLVLGGLVASDIYQFFAHGQPPLPETWSLLVFSQAKVPRKGVICVDS